MKILVLTSTYPRWDNDTEPRFVEDLSLQLAKKNEIHILAPHTPQAKMYEKKMGLVIHRFRYGWGAMETLAYNGGMLPNLKKSPIKAILIPIFLLCQFYATLRLLRKHHFDVIHAHWIIPQGLTAIFIKLCLRTNIQVLITSHGSDLHSLNNVILRKVKQWVLNRSDHITVVSEPMKKAAIQLGLSHNRISVAPMGVDLKSKFTPPESNYHRKNIIFIGRLVKGKGIEHLVKAFELVLKKYPNEVLVIVGDGQLKDELSTLAQGLRLTGQITFLGAIENDMVPSQLRKAKIAVIPSEHEGLGLTAIEALGCECAVVASNIPAFREIIPNQRYGLLSNINDSVDISSKIQLFLSNVTEAQNCAKNGRARCLRLFDWNNAGDTYLEIIDNIVSPN